MDDLIYKNVLIDELKKIRFSCMLPSGAEYLDGIHTAVNRISGIINAAPAVNRWIPVEDALPDKKQKVLVFYKAIGEKNNIHNDVIATNWRKENGDFIPFEGYEITHWMPLPEPPEKE